jgi:hypothetical protein
MVRLNPQIRGDVVAAFHPETTVLGGAMGADKRLAHIVLQTGHLAPLTDWYLTVLDAHVVFEKRDVVIHDLRRGTSPPRNCATAADCSAHLDDGGTRAFAYTFPGLESLLTKYDELRKADIHPHVPVQHPYNMGRRHRSITATPTATWSSCKSTTWHPQKLPSTCVVRSTAATHSGRRSNQTQCSQLSMRVARHPN